MSASGRRLPPEAWAVALAQLPGCGQHRLRAVLDAGGGDPERAWRHLAEGRLAPDLGHSSAALVRRWRSAARGVDPEASWARVTDAGVRVWVVGAGDYPVRLTDDPDPPPILFWQGDPHALDCPAVAIVGTRRCTTYGIDVARLLGRDLAAAGVAVVSGLALGIDGAAHEGALAAHRLDEPGGPGAGLGAAAPVGVVGSGIDVVYPRRHRTLWRRVADHGLLLSEAPPGTLPDGWRFPRRNRILAALARVVVVVESHASGGSLSTVRAAIDRGITVMAVPGSVRSPSSVGTNRLLADGVAPVTDAADVLVALSLEGVSVPRHDRAAPRTTTPPVAVPPPSAPASEPDSAVLRAVDWTPTATEDILRRTGLAPGEAAVELTRLELQGHIQRRGAWWERRSR